MVAIFIDRRVLNQDRNLENRRKFFNRVKGQLIDSIQDLSDQSIENVTKAKRTVKLDSEKLEEPHFVYSQAGSWRLVLSGNSFVVGDEIPKPEDDEGGGSCPSDDGEGEDDFTFEVNEEEFLTLFFEDLELPNMSDKNINRAEVYTWKRQGFTSTGSPSNLELKRTFKNSLGRRVALGRPHIDEVEEKDEDETEEEFQERLAHWKRVPYIDPLDVKYRRFIKNPTPTFSAVIFFLMDVSGSMHEHHKDLAKRFFMLYYFFLQRKYLNVDIVYISHTHVANEVSEDEFFYGQDTGGTIVLTGLHKISEIIRQRYPLDQWNVYLGQASDGDCAPYDGKNSVDYMLQNLLPIMQYACYIDVQDEDDAGRTSSLMSYYGQIKRENFDMVKASKKREIFPVFRKLFSKDRSAKILA